MSDAAIHPIRFILSDVDGTLLHPDHSLGQRTADAVRALREAGVLFSLASGRPPRAMRHLIETFDIDIPLAAFNGGTLFNPDGSILVAHYLPADAALVKHPACRFYQLFAGIFRFFFGFSDHLISPAFCKW